MKLTEHQEEILKKSIDILSTSDRLVITGSAGTGKTFLVNSLLKKIPHLYRSKLVLCTAPTNKAVHVLKDKVDNLNEVRFLSTHAALRMKRVIDYQTGDISFQPQYTKNPPLKGVGILVIDEASMLNTELLNFVEEYSLKFEVKVIFLGDVKQLNPVNEEESPVFIADYPTVELTEIIRQGHGNPIIDLSSNLGLIKDKEDQFIVSPSKDGWDDEVLGYLYSNDRDKVIRTLSTANGSNEVKYLAWTNKEVDLINFLVRRNVYGNPRKIEEGETLVFNSPYEDYYSNETFKVRSFDIREQEFKVMNDKFGGDENSPSPMYKTIKLKFYSINPEFSYNPFKDEEKKIHEIRVIHEDSEATFKKVLQVMKNHAKFRKIEWKDYYEFYEQFADFKYNHAISIHKSQGSTYKKTIVNLKNVNLNRNLKERERLLYTAVTRASDLLILYNH